MKATFYLPAHPSYFGDEYTQEEIDRAIPVFDKGFGGLISKDDTASVVKKNFVLLREPGKTPMVNFDSSGMNATESHKEIAIQQYRRTSTHDLQIHITNLKHIMDGFRKGSEFRP